MTAPVVTFEFHVARSARERYGLDAPWFSLTGNVLIADFETTRRLALLMNHARDAAHHPEREVRAGELHAMGLIDEILHYVAGMYRAEIRADFFNGLNIPHYANPTGTLGNANFGRITSILAQTERVIRFGGRFLF